MYVVRSTLPKRGRACGGTAFSICVRLRRFAVFARNEICVLAGVLPVRGTRSWKVRGGAQGRVAESSRMGAIETIGGLEVEDVDDTRNEIGQALDKGTCRTGFQCTNIAEDETQWHEGTEFSKGKALPEFDNGV